jgi:Flp pilus assembly pilin Flp
MLKIVTLIQSLKASVVQDEEGISAVEYGVLGAFIIAALALAAPLVATGLTTAFTNIQTALG